MRACLRALLVSMSIPWFAAAGPAEKPPVTALVRGKVKSIEQKFSGRAQAVVVEIVHVYSGSSELKGTTFRDAYQAASTTGMEASSPFEEGEEGIWSLMANTEGELWPERDKRYPFNYRSRVGDNKRHAEIVKLAEAAEKVETSKPGDRVKALVSLAADASPEVGVWAVRTLGASEDPAAGKFLDGYADKPDPKLPLAAQVAMDEVLAKRKQQDWTWSKSREAVLKAWADTKVDEYHGMRVLQRIDIADQEGEIKNQLAVELVRTAAGNADWPWKPRRHAIILVGKVGGRMPEDAAAFEWLFEQVKSSKDNEVRRAAAYSVRNFLPLTPKQIKAIEEYVEGEKDKEVGDALRAAVKKDKEKK